MAKRGKGVGKGKGTTDDVIDVEVVGDSADTSGRAARLSAFTVAKPCLIGAALLTLIGAVLPH